MILITKSSHKKMKLKKGGMTISPYVPTIFVFLEEEEEAKEGEVPSECAFRKGDFTSASTNYYNFPSFWLLLRHGELCLEPWGPRRSLH